MFRPWAPQGPRMIPTKFIVILAGLFAFAVIAWEVGDLIRPYADGAGDCPCTESARGGRRHRRLCLLHLRYRAVRSSRIPEGGIRDYHQGKSVIGIFDHFFPFSHLQGAENYAKRRARDVLAGARAYTLQRPAGGFPRRRPILLG